MMGNFIVTGSTSGIGAAVFASIGRDDIFGPIEVHAMTRAVCDFHDCDAVTAHIVRHVEQHGPINGFFHAAGKETVSPLRWASKEVYEAAMMPANSAFGILRAAAKKGVFCDGASIVLMSSVAAHRGIAGMTVYSAARAAVESMTRSAAIELAPRGIRVNCVAAGAFKTPMHDRITKKMTPAGQDAYLSAHPLGFGSTEAVCATVMHLLSDASRWTTGTTVVVDGGYLAK